MFQMQQRRIHHQGLQRKTINEETKDLRENKWWREEHKTGFWRRSWVGIVQEISPVNSQNKYVIPNWQINMERELNMWANMKTKNSKNLKVKALVDFRCTHTEINKQLVKEKRIYTKLINFSFEVFNADVTKNGEMTKVVPLKIKINGHKEQLEAAVMDLNRMDMF